ncbi:unnamed protein product [Lathyrus sativus]|nr:unnamed protein product [Lathyrus sativus]
MEPTSPTQQQPPGSCYSSALPSDDEISSILGFQNPSDQPTFTQLLDLQPQDHTFTQLLHQQHDTHDYQRILHQQNDTFTQLLNRHLLHQEAPHHSSQRIHLYNFADPDNHTNVHIPITATKPRVPSLQQLTLKLLDNHSNPFALFAAVSHKQKQKLSNLLCFSGELNGRFLALLLSGFPTHIQLRNCSWLTRVEFLKYFPTLVTSELEVLQLDKCGSIITDETVSETLAKPYNSLSKLTSLSISGAYQLNNTGLDLLVSSVKALTYVNLTKCVRLTAAGLDILADSFGSTLKDLYIDGFNFFNTKGILQALKRFKQLQVLSLAGIRDLSHEFIKDYIMACGRNIKGLVLKDCVNLKNLSMRFIADFSRTLNVLDITNLCKLTDSSLIFFKNRFRQLNILKLGRSPFSDEAIAAFLEIAGKNLEELSLNSIEKVGHLTALSLARNAKNLHTLDLSHCRNLTDNDLRLIVDHCLSLRTLKLVGCSQLTDVFLRGRANSEIRIIGLKLTPIWCKIYFMN